VTVTDAAGATATQTYTNLKINTTPSVLTSSVPNWTINRLYPNQTMQTTASTGTSPFTWAITAGTQPTGLALSTGGVLSGTPTAANTFAFTVTVTDAAGATATKQFSNVVIAPTPTIATLTVPSWTINQLYTTVNLQTTALTGTAPFSWAITGGAQPTGLALSTGGALSGTPTVANTFSFTVTVTDAAGATANQSYNSVIINPQPTILTSTIPNWTVNQLFTTINLQTTASTGTSPFSWAITAGTQPTGLALSTGGALSGTPTVANTFSFTVTVTDAAGATATQAYNNIVIAAALSITTSLSNGTQGTAYGPVVFAATGGTGAKSFTLDSGSIPTGMTFTAATGTLSGTPTGSGPYSFDIKVTDSVGATNIKSFNITITASPVVITTTTLPDGTVGSGYCAVVQVNNGVPPFTFTISAGSLSGLSLNGSTGVISGTLLAPTAVSVTIQVTDSATPSSTTDSKAYTFNINAAAPSQGSLVIRTLRMPDAATSTPYNQQVVAAGGSGGITLSIESGPGQFPASLSMNGAGTITGTPLPGEVGQYTFTVKAIDGSSNVARANVLLIVGNPVTALSISTSSLSAGTEGTAYPTTKLVAVGGQPPYFWDTAEDSEGPQGMILTSTGVFYGIPRQHGSFSTIFRVRDSSSPARTVTKTLTYAVADPGTGFRVTNLTMPAATVGSAYTHTFSALGGTPGFWIADADGLSKVGLNLDSSTGQVTGTPTASAVLPFIIGAVSTSGARPLSLGMATLTIGQPAGLQITTTSLPDYEVNVAYSAQLTATNNNGSVTWALDGSSPDSLPSFITVNSAGLISGTTTQSTDSTLELIFSATDLDGTRLVYLQLKSVNNHVSLSTGTSSDTSAYTLPFATQGVLVTNTEFSTSNGDEDLTETAMLTGFSLPAGVTLDTARHSFGGTPTVPGRHVLKIKLTDMSGNTGGIQETLQGGEDVAVWEILQSGAFYIATRNLPAGREGAAYSQAIIPEGGTATTYAFAVSAGTLPPGLTLNGANGTLEGTPTAAGTYSFEISVTQASTVKMAYQLPIDPKMIVAVTTDRLPDAPRGVAYNATLDARGSGPFTWSDVGSPTTFGLLGLSLSAGGVVTGTPSAAAGFYNVRVTADNGVNTSTRTVGILIEALPLGMSGFLGAGFVGQSFSGTLQPFGGSGTYTTVVNPGDQLPPGLLLASNVISGTPTHQTSFNHIVFRITDSGTGQTGYGRAEAIMVAADLPTLGFQLAFEDRIDTQVGNTLSAGQKTFTAQGGFPDYTYSTPVGAQRPGDMVPPNLGVNPAGATPGSVSITGTATTSGEYTFVLRVTDSAGTPATAHQIVSVAVRQNYNGTDPTVDSHRVPNGSSGVAYPATQLRGFAFPSDNHSWSFVSGQPAGLNISSSGVLSSASPLAAGTYYFIVRHTDDDTLVPADGRIKLVIE
jgi:hypothetical protein